MGETVEIATETGRWTREVLSKTASPFFVVTKAQAGQAEREGRRFTLTHTRSGFRLANGFRSVQSAVRCMALLVEAYPQFDFSNTGRLKRPSGEMQAVWEAIRHQVEGKQYRKFPAPSVPGDPEAR